MTAIDPAAGVTVTEVSVGLATVHARKGQVVALGEACAAAFGLTPPDGPGFAEHYDTGFVGTGPGKWLAFDRRDKAGWEARLEQALGASASVCDQTGGYILVRLSGPSVRDLLSKGAFLDFHPTVFSPGCAAATVIAHIGVTLWCVAPDVFEVLVFRSYAEAFRHWLAEAGAEYGLA